MEEKELTTLLGSCDLEQGSRTWRCPDENQLAAYVNGQARNPQKTERHLSNCRPCLQTIAVLLKQFDATHSVPPLVLARARTLAQNQRTSRSNWGWTVAAATACLLIVGSIIGWRLWSNRTTTPPVELVAQNKEPAVPIKGTPVNPNSSPAVSSPTVGKPRARESQTPAVRGVAEGPKVTVIFPRNGSTVRLPLPTLSWMPVQNATFYEVKVVTEDGAAVSTQSTNTKELSLPPDTLKAGATYYLTVIAHLSGNRTARSELVRFRVADAR